MSIDIEAETLTAFDVTPDGVRFRLNAMASDGSPVSLGLPSECLHQLVMSLPRVASEALRRQHNDDSLRVVYPAGGWRIERSSGFDETFILTLSTPDGFEVSFAFGSDKMEAIENSVRNARSTLHHRPVSMN